MQQFVQLTRNDKKKHFVAGMQLEGAKFKDLCDGSTAVDKLSMRHIWPHGFHHINSEEIIIIIYWTCEELHVFRPIAYGL